MDGAYPRADRKSGRCDDSFGHGGCNTSAGAARGRSPWSVQTLITISALDCVRARRKDEEFIEQVQDCRHDTDRNSLHDLMSEVQKICENVEQRDVGCVSESLRD